MFSFLRRHRIRKPARRPATGRRPTPGGPARPARSRRAAIAFLPRPIVRRAAAGTPEGIRDPRRNLRAWPAQSGRSPPPASGQAGDASRLPGQESEGAGGRANRTGIRHSPRRAPAAARGDIPSPGCSWVRPEGRRSCVVSSRRLALSLGREGTIARSGPCLGDAEFPQMPVRREQFGACGERLQVVKGGCAEQVRRCAMVRSLDVRNLFRGRGAVRRRVCGTCSGKVRNKFDRPARGSVVS